MSIIFHLNDSPHQVEHGNALAEAMRKDGFQPIFGNHNTPVGDCELAIIWSWKQARLIKEYKARNIPILVMERGFFPERNKWCSLSINGLNGKGAYTEAMDNGERFEKHFSHLVKPWREQPGYVLLIGQVPNDPSLYGSDLYGWLQGITSVLKLKGYTVIYRPHPWVASKISKREMSKFCPLGAFYSETPSLATDLQHCSFCVMFNSNTAVESVLAGVPTVTYNDGSIAWDITSHCLDFPIYMPDRTKWLHDIAWRQWSIDELKDGTAWAYVKENLKKLNYLLT